MNGPEPTGCDALVGSAFTSSSHVGLAIMPKFTVNQYSNAGHEIGWLGSSFLPVCSVTVRSSTLSMTNVPSGLRARSRNAFWLSTAPPVSLRLRIIASAFTGVPSVKFTPGRSLTVHWL